MENTDNLSSEATGKEVYLAPEVRVVECEEEYASESGSGGDTSLPIKDPYEPFVDELGY